MSSTMVELLCDGPQKLLGVDKSGNYGQVLLTETLAVKLVHLNFVVLRQRLIAPPPEPLLEILHVSDETLLVPPACAPAPPHAPLPAATPTHTPIEPSLSAPSVVVLPVEVPCPAPKKVTTRSVLTNMPTQEDINGAAYGFWVELPWRFEWDGNLPRCVRFDEEVSRTQLAASCGISPSYHGCCLVGHSSPCSLYDRIKYPTGILLSCLWLHALIKDELRKLHGTSPHTGCPIGVIVTSRAQCTLANMTPEAAGELLPHVAALLASLDSAHLCAMEHGLIHLDLGPANIVLTKGRSLQLVHWGNAKSNVCLSKLPDAPNKSAILRCILLMTEGIVEDIFSKKVVKNREEERPNGFIHRLLGC